LPLEEEFDLVADMGDFWPRQTLYYPAAAAAMTHTAAGIGPKSTRKRKDGRKQQPQQQLDSTISKKSNHG